MKLRKIPAIIISALMITSLFGCGNQVAEENLLSTYSPLSNETNCAPVKTTASETEKSDIDTYIVLNDTNTVIKGKGVQFENSSLTITKSGTYSVKGKLSDGQIYIKTDDKDNFVTLYLDGIDIYCSTGAPIHIENAPKGTQLILSDESVNHLSDNKDRDTSAKDEEGKSFATATLYSRDDLIIKGEGSLTIDANFNKGIFSRDSLKIYTGNISITSTDDSIKARDSIEIHSGIFNLDAGGDAIKTSNDAEGKGNIVISGGVINAKSSLDTIQSSGSMAISGGCFNLESGGGFSSEIASSNENEGKFFFDRANMNTGELDSISAKGLKSDGPMAISGGKFELSCLDDAIHGNSDIAISGGSFMIQTNDDAVHSDSTLAISSGTFDIKHSYEGIEAQVIAVSGGSINLTSLDDGFNSSSGKTEDFSISLSSPVKPEDVPQDKMPPDGFESDKRSDKRPEGMPDTERPHNEFGFNRGNKPDFGGGMDKYDENCKINISGGVITVNAGGDGLDSNGNIIITGGTVLVSGSTDGGNSAIDYSGSFTMDGGTLAATGDSRMSQGISDGKALSLNVSHNFNEGDKVKINDDKGNEVYSFTVIKSANELIFADSKLLKNESCTLFINGSAAGTYNVR